MADGSEEAKQSKYPPAITSLWETVLEFAAHVVLVLVLLGGFALVHWAYNKLHPGNEPIWGTITMDVVFKVFDYLLIVGIMGVGTYKVLKAYTKHD